MLKASIRFLNVTTNPPPPSRFGAMPPRPFHPRYFGKKSFSRPFAHRKPCPFPAKETIRKAVNAKDRVPFQRQPFQNLPELISTRIRPSAVCQRRRYPSGNPSDKAGTHERGPPFGKKERLVDSRHSKSDIRQGRSKRKSDGGNAACKSHKLLASLKATSKGKRNSFRS